MIEEWKNITGYEGLYQVSNMGRVRRLPRRIVNHGTQTVKKGSMVAQYPNRKGYMRLNLFKDGKMTEYFVHRLVAKAFVPNTYNLPDINHKSEVKTENRADNLEWCDKKYNNNFGTRTQRAIAKQEYAVVQKTLGGDVLKEYPSIQEAGRQTSISAGHICLVCQVKRPSAGGYRWTYK